jgi:hypothetical protein
MLFILLVYNEMAEPIIIIMAQSLCRFRANDDLTEATCIGGGRAVNASRQKKAGDSDVNQNMHVICCEK